MKETLVVVRHADSQEKHPPRDSLSALPLWVGYLGGSDSIICKGNAPISLYDDPHILLALRI